MDSISKIQIGSNQYQISSKVNTDFANALIGGENLLRGTRYPGVTSGYYGATWEHGKFEIVDATGHSQTSGVTSVIIDNCPANSDREKCGALLLDTNRGIIQRSHHILGELMPATFLKYRNSTKGGDYGVASIVKMPITFSFYCKSASHSIIKAGPFFDDLEALSQYEVTDTWQKISITKDFTLNGDSNIIELLFEQGIAHICCVEEYPCYIACPMLTIGEYDVDWKPNPLDAKSDIIGVGNLLRGSNQLNRGDSWKDNLGYCCLSSDNFYEDGGAFVETTIVDNCPGAESFQTVNAFVVNVTSSAPAGMAQRYDNTALSNHGIIPGQISLIDYINNSETVVPVSMSVWCFAESANANISLMPICDGTGDLFAPISSEYLPMGEWHRFTRTIYIPAGYHISTDTLQKLMIGGVLALYNNGETHVKFALPMVTFGSTPSTWFPSAYDILSGIDSAASSASNALSTANSASSLATTANSNANTALTTANNKVSKSGDTMSGNLNMDGNNITNVNTINVDNIVSDSTDYVSIISPLSVEAHGFYDETTGDLCTDEQLMQGDGYPRNIETTLTNSTNIPTGSAVLGLKVGGRNLLRGTKDITVEGTWQEWRNAKFRKSGTGTISTVTYADGLLPVPGCTKTIKLESSTGAQVGIAQDCYKYAGTSNPVSFKAGDTLCLSYWVKPSVAGAICYIQPICDQKLGTTDDVGGKVFTLSAGWQRIWYSGTKTHDTTFEQGDSIGYIYSQTSGASIEVCCPKLEFGQVPTDWTPALEDATSTNYGFELSSVGTTSATSYTWQLSSTDGCSSDYKYFDHTASTLSISINPSSFKNYQYLLVAQSTNTCTITITCSSGGLFTKGNITSFTVSAGQRIEFSAVSISSIQTYVTYTIFG